MRSTRAVPPAPRDTRERIIGASLSLFNSEGLAAVPIHRIAAELGISPGNLHYHFKTKEAIVTWLVRRFDDQLAPCTEPESVVTALDDLWLTLHLLFESIDAYRFVFRDVDFLLNEYPALEARVRALTGRNLAAAQAWCSGLAGAHVLQGSDHDMEMLALQLVLSISCWFTFKRLTPKVQGSRHDEASLGAYFTLSMLSPYVSGESRDYLNFLRVKYLG